MHQKVTLRENWLSYEKKTQKPEDKPIPEKQRDKRFTLCHVRPLLGCDVTFSCSVCHCARG